MASQVRVPLQASAHTLHVAYFDIADVHRLMDNEPSSKVEIDVQPVIGWMIDAASDIYAPDPLSPIGLISDEYVWCVAEDANIARSRALQTVDELRAKEVRDVSEG